MGVKINPKQYAISLYKAASGLSEKEIRIVIENFINLLIKNNALKLGPKIIDYLDQFVKKEEGIVDLKIISAQKLDAMTISKIERLAPFLVGREIKKIKIMEEIDPNLIGGIILKCDDLIFDNSVKNRLIILKKNLKP